MWFFGHSPSRMFWQCCRRSNGEYRADNRQENSKKQNKKGNTLPLFLFICVYCVSFSTFSGSQEAYDMEVKSSTISNDLNHNGSIPTPTNERRLRTESSSSIKSSESFYSVKSSATSAGADGDFYSVCSVDSFKST